MNVITNRCLGGYIYRDILKSQYENPFIWTGISDDSFNAIFGEYEHINFNKFRVEQDETESGGKYYIIIDETYRVNYRHVLLDPTCKTPTIKDVNIYTCNPQQYITEKYMARLSRMKSSPIFIYMDLDYTKNYQIAELAYRMHRPINILTVDSNYPVNEFAKIQLVLHQDWRKISWWKYLYTHYATEIGEFLK